MGLSRLIVAILSCGIVATTTAFCTGFDDDVSNRLFIGGASSSSSSLPLFEAIKKRSCNNDDDDAVDDDFHNNWVSPSNDRRTFLASSVLLPHLSLLPTSFSARAASVPVQRAVGSAESKCRSEGNCLENFELDGAVGWNWGGADRCDASNPLCGTDGRLRDEPLSGMPVPSPKSDDGMLLDVTHLVELTLQIGTGSNAEVAALNMGLYGQTCPELVEEMTDLCSKTGLVTSKDLLLGAPVRLGMGGSLTYVVPEERIEFGVASQRVSYAKSIRRPKAPEEFVPQARPGGTRLQSVREEQSSRKHDAAGLVSVPRDGIGYGGGMVLGKDDEAYASAFQITAKAVPDMDKEGRKVIGQLIDKESMDLLARLAGSPTRKLIPGQNGGTSLIKVTVEDCSVSSVAELVADSAR